jgi:methionyl-tRNA synthetase
MHNLAESLRRVAIMIQPFMTNSPKEIVRQLGLSEKLLAWDTLNEENVIPKETKVVDKGVPIFPRLDTEEEVTYIRDQMRQSVKTPTEEPKKEEVSEITIDDFMKVDLRVATVTACDKVPKADKLLKLQLDLGYEQRQVVSGIAEYYQPQELVGRKVIVVANLKPVKLRGELSQGMILAGSKDGVLTLATVDEKLENGAKVK